MTTDPATAARGDDPAGGYEVVAALGAQLGEGPVWDVRTGRLVWIDILGRAVHETDPETGRTSTIEVPLDVGAVVPRAAGGFLAALEDGFYVVGDGPVRRVALVDHAVSGEFRFNDGKCDPGGRFWAGTIAYDESPGRSALYLLDGGGGVTTKLSGVAISNGLAWSADAATMFYIDTPTRRIDAFTFDVATGSIADRRTVVTIEDGLGWPDGMTIDADGGLWVALWGGGAVHRYVDGTLDAVIELPVSQPTSCAFGGPDFDELYVTSAWKGFDGARRAAEPLAGALFRTRPGVRGLAPHVAAAP